MPSDTPAPRWRFLFRPKWLGWHALMVLTVLGMLALGDWQFRRAESGNSLSWAYTFEWPIFAIFVIAGQHSIRVIVPHSRQCVVSPLVRSPRATD